MRASISVPGLFEPIYLNGDWYVDGGIVNPIPVSLCRALGADIVIAVDVNRNWKNQISRRIEAVESEIDKSAADDERELELFQFRLTKGFKDRVGEAISGLWRGNTNKPELFSVLNNSAHFMQESIKRSRLACDPPDLILYPTINGIGLMDFHRAAMAIEAGKDCVYRNKTELLEIVSN